MLSLITDNSYGRHPALTRSHHTLTVLSDTKAVIFGGQDSDGRLCPPAIHVITLPEDQHTQHTRNLGIHVGVWSHHQALDQQQPAEHLERNEQQTGDGGNDYRTAYTCYPPFTLQDPSTGEVLVPAPRSRHAACARGGYRVLVHGGRGVVSEPAIEAREEEAGLNEDARKTGEFKPLTTDKNCIWQWNYKTLSWSKLPGDITALGQGEMKPRYGHWLFWGKDDSGLDDQLPTSDEESKGEYLVLIGGQADSGEDEDVSKEVWLYEFDRGAWSPLPSAPASPVAAAFVNQTVYIISNDAPDDGSDPISTVHYLPLNHSAVEREKADALAWHTVSIPPGSSSPRPRTGAYLVPIRINNGKEDLLYLFGLAVSPPAKRWDFCPDVWALQLPLHRRLSVDAAVGDEIKGTGSFKWTEAEAMPTKLTMEEGKVHPGLRAFFGADSCLKGRGVVLWAGVNALGKGEGDGWVLRVVG